jgi:hypothetical protein
LQPNFADTGELKIKKRRQKKLVYTVNENESNIELPEVPTYKTTIRVPEFLQTISNENELVKTLLSVANIGPEYEKIISRPDSPTLSEEEDLSNPLAARLLRKIIINQASSELACSGVEAGDRISSENIQAMTSTADIDKTPGAVENIISENSKYKSGEHTEVSNSDIELLKNQPDDIENLATGMCSSQSMNKEDQFPNLSARTRLGKGASMRKRKLFPLLQCDSPEVLNTVVSTVTDETSHLSVQCPYVTKRKNAGGKKKKTLHPVSETSVKKFSTYPPSTSSLTKQKCRQGTEHETKNKVPCYSRSSSDEFIMPAKQPLEKEDKPWKMLQKKLPSLVCTGLHRQ